MTQLILPINRRDHIKGPRNAPVTLVEYADYECPYCGQAYWFVKDLEQSLGDLLCFVFRNFPLANVHPHAEHAAEAAEASGAQGKFWRCMIVCLSINRRFMTGAWWNMPRRLILMYLFLFVR
jgi:protein-disulfide isomerase